MPTEGGGGPSKELKKRQKGKIPPIFFPVLLICTLYASLVFCFGLYV